MMQTSETDGPYYFGRERELFGMYAPATQANAPCVLLCPPLGQELIRSHRIYRQIAHALAARGMAVLRFDYFGSGDSTGDSSDTDWLRCIEDARTAANELRRLNGREHVVAFGARLGAAVAMSAAPAAHINQLLLWDPVLDGAQYVKNMDAMQRAVTDDSMRFPKPRPASAAAGQWLGFTISQTLREQLSALQVDTPDVPCRVFDSRPPTSLANWTSLESTALGVTRLQPPVLWEQLDRIEQAILLPDLVRAVVKQAWNAP